MTSCRGRDAKRASLLEIERFDLFQTAGGMMTYYATKVRSTTSRSSSSHLDAFATQSILRDIEGQKMGEQF